MRISGFYLIFILLFGQLIYADEFYNAIMSGDKDLALKVLLLAENKNKLNDFDLLDESAGEGMTSFQYYCMSYPVDANTLEALVKAGADINLLTQFNARIIDLLIYKDDLETYKYLFNKMGGLNDENRFGIKDFIGAIQNHSCKIATWLIKQGVDVNYHKKRPFIVVKESIWLEEFETLEEVAAYAGNDLKSIKELNPKLNEDDFGKEAEYILSYKSANPSLLSIYYRNYYNSYLSYWEEETKDSIQKRKEFEELGLLLVKQDADVTETDQEEIPYFVKLFGIDNNALRKMILEKVPENFLKEYGGQLFISCIENQSFEQASDLLDKDFTFHEGEHYERITTRLLGTFTVLDMETLIQDEKTKKILFDLVKKSYAKEKNLSTTGFFNSSLNSGIDEIKVYGFEKLTKEDFDESGYDLIITCIQSGEFRFASILIDNGASLTPPPEPEIEGEVLEGEHQPISELIVEEEVVEDEIPPIGDIKYTSIITFLIEQSENLDNENKKDFTDLLIKLFKKGEVVNVKDGEMPLLYQLIQLNDKEILDAVSKYLNLKNPENYGSNSPFEFAVYGGQYQAAEFLLARNFSKLNKEPSKLLEVLYTRKDHDFLLPFIKQNGDTAGTTLFDKESLLHLFYETKQFEFVKEIYVYATPKARGVYNQKGKSILTLAVEDKREDFIEYILSKDVQFENSNSLLHEAIQSGDLNFVKKIYEAKPALYNSKNSHGLTPIQWSIFQGQEASLSYLATFYKDVPMGVAYEGELMADPRVEYFSILYWTQQHAKLIEKLEEDLNSSSPCVFSSYLWADTHRTMRTLKNQLQNIDQKSKTIQLNTHVFWSKVKDRNQEVIKMYPPTYAFEKTDLLALAELYFIAGNLAENDMKIAYLIRGMELSPDFWQFLWSFIYFENENPTKYKALAQEVLNNEKIAGSQTAEALTRFLEVGSASGLDLRKALEKWIHESPHDSRAITALSYNLAGRGYNEDSFSLGTKAVVLFPFFSNWHSMLNESLKLNKDEWCKRYIELSVKAFSPKEKNFNSRVIRIQAQAYFDEGNKGKALKLIVDNIASHPEDLVNYKKIASFYAAFEQHDKAIKNFEKYFKNYPKSEISIEDKSLWIRYQSANGNLSEAYEYAEKLIDSKEELSIDFYNQVYTLASENENTSLADLALNEGIKFYPKSQQLLLLKLNSLWTADEQDQAWELLQTILADNPINEKYYSLWGAWAKERLGEDAVRKDIDQKTAKYPTQLYLWKLKLKYAKGNPDIYDFWENARLKSKQKLFALDEQLQVFLDDSDYIQASKLLERLQVELHNDQESYFNKEGFLLNRMYIYELQSKRQLLTEKELANFKSILTQYNAGRTSQVNYFRYLESYHFANQDGKSASDAFSKLCELDKSNTGFFHDCVSKHSDHLNDKQKQGYGYRMLNRNPYDEKILASYLHKQVRWTGSYMNALWAVDRAQKLGLKYNESLVRDAKDKLGVKGQLYENYRLGYSYPGTSQRYLNWYSSARKNALNSTQTQINLDFEAAHPTLQIISDSGEVTTKSFHPIFGKLTYVKQGAKWLTISYDENGSLTSIKDSSGKFIQIRYNLLGSISVIETNDKVLNFKYNEMKKPVLISIVGVGSIDISYDDQGEITRVESAEGQAMALQVTQAFQNFLKTVQLVQRNMSDVDLLGLETKDNELVILEEKFYSSEVFSIAYYENLLKLCEYYVANYTHSSSYHQNANALLIELFEHAKAGKADDRLGVRSVVLWHKLTNNTKPYGVPLEDFGRWKQMRIWLEAKHLNNQAFKKEIEYIDSKPIQLLKNATWLSKENLSNSSYWNKFDNTEIFEGKFKGVKKQALLIRQNGDLVLGTDQGFGVYKESFWHWYSFDAASKKFYLSKSINVATRANILSITEDENGTLWVGTAGGLFKTNNYTDGEWFDGNVFEQARTSQIISAEGGIYCLNPQGIFKIVDEKTSLLVNEADIKKFCILNEVNQQFLVLKGGKLFLSLKGDLQLLFENVDLFHYDETEGFLYGKEVNTIFKADLFSMIEERPHEIEEIIASKSIISLQSDLLISKNVQELNVWDIGEFRTFIVNTDISSNLLKDHFFLPFELPFEVSRGGVQVGPSISYQSTKGDILIATDEGIYYFNPSSAIHHFTGSVVHDTLADNQLGVTFVATEDGIYTVDHQNIEAHPILLTTSRSRILRKDKDQNLITHDGLRVVRIKRGDTTIEELFYAEETEEAGDWARRKIYDIMIDSKNIIWVCSGSSLFKYDPKTQESTEFNYFLDSDKFPARSYMLKTIYETLKGEIMVVASNEGHLNHMGVDLFGGLLKLEGDKFVNLGQSETGWFTTGYTKMSDDQAMIATNYSFVKENQNIRLDQNIFGGTSYNEMRTKHPMIWLGGNGDAMEGGKTWLFPSAGGVLVYHNSKWFYPDRINQLLPKDQELGLYGARHVHNLAIDQQQNVYVGTDLGLLIYKSNGVESLLSDNHQGGVAFTEFNTSHQERMNEIFLSKIDTESKAGRLLEKYKKLEKVPEDPDQTMQGEEQTTETSRGKDREVTEEERENYQKKLKARERARQKLLARIEKDHYGLFQMLKMDPREISSLNRKLQKDQAIIQYLPTKEKLLVQVVTKEGTQIHEVKISSDKLYKLASTVSKSLKEKCAQMKISRGIKMSFDKQLNEAVGQEGSIESQLHELHRYLITPLKSSLIGKKHLFISPVGALTYVPFSALVSVNKPKIRYLFEDYEMAILPSLYHFTLMMYADDSISDKALFIADPDGSLKGAKDEVSSITKDYAYDTIVLEGEEATMDNIELEIEDSKVAHFATHGILDPNSPASSYLLLADQKRLSVIDISCMSLDETDLAILSACESGIGAKGLEYATLARAFAHAKVPTVVASYWQVNDEATKLLMTYFYEGLNEEELNYSQSMNYARGKMLKHKGVFSNPAAWASFEVFGKP
ncbi:MAG: CHAT domain-containing protein [Lentisphaeria bacterium]|nr:CHAT domain-containing protein [Lentisphaeria bacterium]